MNRNNLHFMRNGISKFCIFIATFFIFLFQPLFADPFNLELVLNGEKTRTLSQNGITWTFSEPVEFGKFINDDYWVVGPVEIIDIYPPSENVAGRILNGSEINPDPTGGTQGFDSSMTYNTYDDNLNVALGVSSTSPLIINSPASLVSSISVSAAGNTPQLQAAAILTVLNASPPENSFRPSYTGTNKTIRFNDSDINRNYFKNLSPIGNSTPSWDDANTWFEKPWLDYRGSVSGRMLHPVDNMPNYGREMATMIGAGALMLNLDYPWSIKNKLLYGFLQYGIDLWGVLETGFSGWYQDGGHGGGRKFPILLAGLILGDVEMLNIGSLTTYYYNHIEGPIFGEDQTTIYLNEQEATRYIDNVTGLYPSTNAHRDYTDAYYTSDDWNFINSNGIQGIPEYSKWYGTTYQGRWISKRLDASYRRECHVNGFTGFILAVHILDLKDEWNHDALFDYADRYLAWSESVEAPSWHMHFSTFNRDMWNEYRSDYAPVWPD